ncbi:MULTISPECIES: YqjD family protein [unclassified Nitrosospira]|jgi:ElaB/YqjD/DUF883 family membrane-anchored ribosome-binding protein|uniref:DUF883 family protein n=1 Tax=unclassified Nitrosospira TaxID=2609267 RepID=UPI000D32672D|nr:MULTISPECIES: DUF883 family protein [unclassified Nitrosospira]PTR13465.1 ElaB/YqjD/DUF883 family membrane-anchored ribosome-binding protein [Nitrosospira sp. Nsp2]WON72957.1 DUF883 family protein [Nitrosospira sp. Is2]
MERDTSTNTAEDTKAAAENVAHRVGDAAQRVGNAAKTAGKQVGAVASDELANLRADLDDLISRIPSLSDIDLEKAKDNLIQKIAETKETARDVAHEAREQLDHGIECTRDYVKERPLQSVGYAAAIGLLVGLLTARR